MKHIIKLFVSVLLILSFVLPANASELQSNSTESSFSFYNEEGETVTVLIQKSDSSAIAKVYVDGALTQKSIANYQTKRIETEIFDIEVFSKESGKAETGLMNGFQTIVTHVPVSNERITVENVVANTRSIYNEPVDNSGLSQSAYGDGYYYLGSAGNLSYAPNITGGLYRSYTKTYDGETKYWSWTTADTLSGISAYLALFGAPVAAIVSMLLFSAAETLLYNQAIELATYTFNYNYRVRVYGTIHYTAQRNKTYWEVYNTTTNRSKWEFKSFNYGFPQDNFEMIVCGIDNYLLSIQ